MFLLYILSGIIAYAHKIPFIGRIISLASLYYGRTTIWKILVKIRKGFIIFNALIGVYMVFHTVGFSMDNILAGFMAMGHEYLLMLTNFTSRLFNWFVEFFDHKVVPNVPNTPSTPKNPKSFIPKLSTPIEIDNYKPLSKDILYNKYSLKDKFSLRELYTQPPINIEINPWYKDLTTWLWIGGTLCTIGLLYSGYKFLTDPTFIENIWSNNTTPTVRPNIPGDSPSPDITLTDRVTKGLGFITTGVGNVYSYTTNKLNPLNWFTSTTDINNQFNAFLDRQKDMVTADRRYYPFTEVNPILPWYKQLKTQLFGESVSESLERFKDRQIADRIYDSLQVSKGKFKDVVGLTPVTTPIYTPTPNDWIGKIGVNTPTIGSGLKTPFIEGFNFYDHIKDTNLINKLNSLTPTPTEMPTISHTNLEDIGGSATDWNNKTPIASTSKTPTTYNTYADAVKNNPVADIEVHDKYYDVLSEL